MTQRVSFYYKDNICIRSYKNKNDRGVTLIPPSLLLCCSPYLLDVIYECFLKEIDFSSFQNCSHQSSSDLNQHWMIIWFWITSNFFLSLPVQSGNCIQTVQANLIWAQYIGHGLQRNLVFLVNEDF